MKTFQKIIISAAIAGLPFSLSPRLARAADEPPTTTTSLPPIEFTKETLDNGLRVIYAPMKNAPVVHVRVLYHVGSRDERPDRQGFAHMFEHMMFRGSQHVAPEQHMKLIGEVGGNSNAFTSFDQTTYVNTIPSADVEMALYLEADRMASFKVSDDIFKTERKVVSEEWRLRTANPPYGQLFQDFAKTVYKDHSYRWTPIGDMDQLRAAKSSELQSFFNTYYVPNNACLIIAGDIDVDQTKQWVKKYFGWIPKSAQPIQRDISAEPEQTEARALVVYKNVPLPTILMGWKTTTFASDDHDALGLLGDILSRGRTSRLNSELVNSAKPECQSVSADDDQLEDVSTFSIEAQLRPGNDAKTVQNEITSTVDDVIRNGVTKEELDRVKTGQRVALIRGRETCTQIATILGEQEVFGGDASRVNDELPKLNAVTSDEVQRVARKYLQPQRLNVVDYLPDPTGKMSRAAAASQAATQDAKAQAVSAAPVVASDAPIEPRVKDFPPGYPTKPPMAEPMKTPEFVKGDESNVDNVKLIVMADHRLPVVSASLIMRRGGDSVPADKTGLAEMTAQLLRRGAGELSYAQLSEDLESRGISIDATDGGDNTRLNISCTADQLDHAIDKAHDVLTKPTFPELEFNKLKQQSVFGLVAQLANGPVVAQRELSVELWGDSPLGRQSTPQSLGSITLDDVKHYYSQTYHSNDAVLVISGDVTIDRAKDLAGKLLSGLDPAKEYPAASYDVPTAATSRKIILIDNPDAKQSSIRMAIRAYRTEDAPEAFAGTLASQILSSGIDSRLGKYVRAEKGYTYGVSGFFRPGRHGGLFNLTVDTNPETTGPCVEACFKVLHDMASGAAPITDAELADAKRRAIGGLVMDTQTIQSQSMRRVDALLNGFPLDYYDQLPDKVNAITAQQVTDVAAKYINNDAMTVVICGPGAQVKSQLDSIGSVEVKPMPVARPTRHAPTTGPSDGEMMK